MSPNLVSTLAKVPLVEDANMEAENKPIRLENYINEKMVCLKVRYIDNLSY